MFSRKLKKGEAALIAGEFINEYFHVSFKEKGSILLQLKPDKFDQVFKKINFREILAELEAEEKRRVGKTKKEKALYLLEEIELEIEKRRRKKINGIIKKFTPEEEIRKLAESKGLDFDALQAQAEE